MKRLLAILFAGIVCIAGYVWRGDETVTIDADLSDELDASIQKDVVDEFKKSVDEEVTQELEKEIARLKSPADGTADPHAAASGGDTKWSMVSGGSWEPTRQTLDDMKLALQPFVQQGAAERKLQLPEWSRYGFQYQGTEKDGHKRIAVSGHCKPLPAEYPKDTFFIIPSEGPCFFETEYDPGTGRFSRLKFGELLGNES